MSWQIWLPHIILAIAAMLFLIVSYLLFRCRRTNLLENKQHRIFKMRGPRIQGVALNPRLRELLKNPSLMDEQQQQSAPQNSHYLQEQRPTPRNSTSSTTHNATANSNSKHAACPSFGCNESGNPNSSAAPQILPEEPIHQQKKNLPIIGLRGNNNRNMSGSRRKRRNVATASGGFLVDDTMDMTCLSQRHYNYDNLF